MNRQQDLGTWREQRVSIPAKSLVSVSFVDTNPNYFFMVNGGAGTVFASVNSIPTADKYDTRIEGKKQRLYCGFHGFHSLYLYNDGTEATVVMVKSFEWSFDPLVLAQDVEDVEQPRPVTSDATIKAFSVSLPTGVNHIGGVEIDRSLPAGTNNIGKVSLADNSVKLGAALPAGTNNIGKVSLADNSVKLGAALPAGTNNIGKVSLADNSVKLGAALPAGTNNIGKVSLADKVEFSVGETLACLSDEIDASGGSDVSWDAYQVNTLVTLKNCSSSTGALYVDFPNQSTAFNAVEAFSISPGEALSGIPCPTGRFRVTALAGTKVAISAIFSKEVTP